MKKTIPILTLIIILAFAGVLAGCCGDGDASYYAANNRARAIQDNIDMNRGVSQELEHGSPDLAGAFFSGAWVDEYNSALMTLEQDYTGYYYADNSQDSLYINWEFDSSRNQLLIYQPESGEPIAAFKHNEGTNTYTQLDTGTVCTNQRWSQQNDS